MESKAANSTHYSCREPVCGSYQTALNGLNPAPGTQHLWPSRAPELTYKYSHRDTYQIHTHN